MRQIFVEAKKMSKGLVTLSVLLVIAGFLLFVFMWSNPFNWFIPTSSKFDVDRFFDEVKVDSPLSEVIEEFGEPLDVKLSSWEPWRRPYCQGCLAYYFAGPAPEWVDTLYMRYRGAIVHADKDGIVKAVHMLTEE